jgi:hypothetical protein
MQKLFLPLFLLLFIHPTDCVAKAPRTLDASISAEAGEADRGVLGVKYAVGMDMLKKTHVIVMNIVPGGPAEAAGLKKGDRIVAIDGVEVRALPLKGVGPKMAGAPNTVLHLTVKRGLDDLQITLTRGGLTKLPESAFKTRLIANAVNEDRDARIKSLCSSIAAKLPNLCATIEGGYYRDAETRLQRAIKADPDSLNEQLLYALILDRTGTSNTGEQLLEDLVARKPEWAEAWESLALSYEARGNYADAVEALKKAAVLVTDKDTETSIRQRIGELSIRGKE